MLVYLHTRQLYTGDRRLRYSTILGIEPLVQARSERTSIKYKTNVVHILNNICHTHSCIVVTM